MGLDRVPPSERERTSQSKLDVDECSGTPRIEHVNTFNDVTPPMISTQRGVGNAQAYQR